MKKHNQQKRHTHIYYIYIYMKYICDTIRSFSQHHVTKFDSDLRQVGGFLLVPRAPGFTPWFWCCSSVVFSWYPEHLGLPSDFWCCSSFQYICCVSYLFVFVPYVASFSGLFISLTFMQYINYQLELLYFLYVLYQLMDTIVLHFPLCPYIFHRKRRV